MKIKNELLWIFVLVQFALLLSGCGKVEDNAIIEIENNDRGRNAMETPVLPNENPDITFDNENPDITFDIESTTAVLERMLENYKFIRGEDTIERIIFVLAGLEIQGVLRGVPIREFGDFVVAFEIESEDHKVYEITMEGRYVIYVVDKKTDEMIYYVHNPSGHWQPQE